MNKVKRLILHHSAISRTKNNHQFEAINNYHKKKWNFKSKFGYYIGYAYLIEPNGEVIQGRYENEAGAHCKGQNNSSVGICLTGNFDREEPTDEQIKALSELVKKLLKKYKLKESDIKFHREYCLNADGKPYKSCPGNLIKDNFKNMITKEQELYMDEKGGYWFCKSNDGGKQKIDSINGLLTVISRKLGVDRISEEELKDLKDKKYF